MRPLVALLSLALPALLLWGQYRVDDHERALGEVASAIAGRPVTVACQGLPSSLLDATAAAGEVQFDHAGTPADETLLKRDTCRALRGLGARAAGPSFGCVLRLAPCDRETARAASAVRVLAHEAWHLRGIRVEAEAECYALQTTAVAAHRLGATEEQARAVAVWNLRHVYPRLPSDYRGGNCRDGGPWDLRPETTVWP